MTRDWWYWPATNADPKTNRVDTGLLLWRSNLYGAFLPDYQTAFGLDPYDETSAGACPSKAAFRPLMLTYPVKDGVLDTLQWEACREGVNDVRYLTTMYAALRECKDAHIAKPLVGEAEGYVKTFLDKPLANLPEPQYDALPHPGRQLCHRAAPRSGRLQQGPRHPLMVTKKGRPAMPDGLFW